VHVPTVQDANSISSYFEFVNFWTEMLFSIRGKIDFLIFYVAFQDWMLNFWVVLASFYQCG
jgi:hypothetical protein